MLSLGLFLFSLASGFVIFRFILILLPVLERRVSRSQSSEVHDEARRQAQRIRVSNQSKLEDKLALMQEDLELSLEQLREDISASQKLCGDRVHELDLLNNKVERTGEEVSELSERVFSSREEIARLDQRVNALRSEAIEGICRQLKASSKDELARMGENIVAERSIELQRLGKQVTEDLVASSKKLAQRLLDRVHSRYAPQFLWPKPTNVVEINDPKLVESYANDEHPSYRLLSQLSEVTISVRPQNETTLVVRFGGGFGVFREAARLSFEQLVQRSGEGNIEALYLNNRQLLEAKAKQLGRRAVDLLQLENIHPEIQNLVGALNWRTSYRQNQWHHTVEVARLAGLLACELGVDPEDAKRVGLLHDIGKAIDYRIEGSHAVISGDYADRFGEKRHICDTVMSHHDDLRVESPLAYLLQAADTLSGARPGARVNIEEGYQVRLSAIHDVVANFAHVQDVAVMNGGREIHMQVDCGKVAVDELEQLSAQVAGKIQEQVAFPGQIRILITRSFEASAIA